MDARKVCHACVCLPRDSFCGVCDNPVPPAGVICDEVAPITEQAWHSLDSQPAGDVEVSNDACRQRFTTWIDQKMGGAMLGEVVVAEYHDAHVTRLTAENARLKARADSHWKGLIDMRDERDALKAEAEQLKRWQATVRENSPLLIQLDALQSELTKARELLESAPWVNWVSWSRDTRAFLAHQSAPAAKGGE